VALRDVPTRMGLANGTRITIIAVQQVCRPSASALAALAAVVAPRDVPTRMDLVNGTRTTIIAEQQMFKPNASELAALAGRRFMTRDYDVFAELEESL